MENKLSANDVQIRLHKIIDKEFKRKDRNKTIDPHSLKAKMTLWKLYDEFPECGPELLCTLFKELVERGSVEINLGEEGVFPFDAYFIPTAELKIGEKDYKTYLAVKKMLL